MRTPRTRWPGRAPCCSTSATTSGRSSSRCRRDGRGEVEIRRVGGQVRHGHHPHVAVVDRPAGDRTVPSLVFGELAEGSYELYEKGGGPVRLTAEVRGGAVTEVTWG